MTATHDDDRADGTKNTGNHGRWDPFKTFRRFLSPEERMELLRIKRPLRPPEDFMNTVELQQLRSTQFREKLRHLTPAIIGLGTFLVVLIGATLWYQPWSSPLVSAASATAPAPEVATATSDNHGPATKPNSNSLPTAQAAPPSPSPVPSEGASPPARGATLPPHASPRKPVPTAASAARPVPTPKVQTRHSDDLDLDTPMAPAVH